MNKYTGSHLVERDHIGSDHIGSTSMKAGKEEKEKQQEPREPELISHPSHYNFGSLEVIDIIEDWRLGFHEGNAVKYILRAKHKGAEIQDLNKAIWYLQRRVSNIEKEKVKNA